MPSGGSIPGEIALNARPRSPLARGAMASSQSCGLSVAADAVVAVTIFHQHFPSMLAM